MHLYDELTEWYRLVDPPADHAGEVAAYREALLRAAPHAKTLLELGSGAGHNAVHLVDHFEVTFSDLSPRMLALSRELHPARPHHLGDLRTLRLEQTFDAVLLHDAVMYLTSEADLRAAFETLRVHLKDDGAAVVAMDALKDDFEENTELLSHDAGGRSMRGIMWSFDPDPDDDTFITDFVFALREGTELRTVHDRHVEGLFTRERWERVARESGFLVSWFDRPSDDEGAVDPVLLLTRAR